MYHVDCGNWLFLNVCAVQHNLDIYRPQNFKSRVLLLCVTPNSNSLPQCSLYNFTAVRQLQAWS